MAGERIHKSERAGWPTPNLQDYAEVRSGFSWEQARSALRGVPGGGLNIAFEAVDRHLDDGLPEGTLSLADVLDACPDPTPAVWWRPSPTPTCARP